MRQIWPREMAAAKDLNNLFLSCRCLFVCCACFAIDNFFSEYIFLQLKALKSHCVTYPLALHLLWKLLELFPDIMKSINRQTIHTHCENATVIVEINGAIFWFYKKSQHTNNPQEQLQVNFVQQTHLLQVKYELHKKIIGKATDNI